MEQLQDKLHVIVRCYSSYKQSFPHQHLKKNKQQKQLVQLLGNWKTPQTPLT